MEKFSLSGCFRYAVCLCLLMCGGLQQGWGQTENDLILVEPGGFKLCSNDAKGEQITIYNQCVHPGFKNGTFKVDWGDGSPAENWGSEETRKHTYVPFGVFSVVFSWEATDGSKKLSKTYQVMRLTKAMVTLKEGDGGSSCVNKDKEIKFVDYQGQTPGTVYFIDYGDGQNDSFTQKDIAEKHKGVIKHRFDVEQCPIIVTLRTQNECLEKLEWETTFKTAVVVPPKARFQFIGAGCTGHPVGVQNISKEGVDLSCNQSTDYVWKFGDKPSTFEKEPSVSFDTPGEYEIRLIASTGGLECSRDTMIKKVTIVKSPEVHFTIDRDVICSGEVVRVTDNSLGDDIRYYWSVYSDPANGYHFMEGTDENSPNPVFRLDGRGEYTLHLSLRNLCPQSEDSKKVTVLKSPVIRSNSWQDSLCADDLGILALDLKDYVEIDWNGNPVKVDWKIEPEAGMPGRVEYVGGSDASSEYPKVGLAAGGVYKISLTLDGVFVDGVECGEAVKRTFSKTLKVKDSRITLDVVPDKLPGADGRIKICDGEEVAFVNNSTGERLKYFWSVVAVGSNDDPGWNIEYAAGSATAASPTIRFNGYGDFMVTGRMSTDCNAKSISFLVRVMKDPNVFLTNFPKELCPRDVLDAGLCIFYNWYNNPPKAHWEFTPNTVDVVEGTLNSPEPKIHFRTSEKYTYKVTVPGVGCPNADTVISGELRVRVAGLNSTVKEKNNRSEICEGDMLVFTNSASEKDPEGTDLRYEWTVAVAGGGQSQGGTADDCQFLNDKKNESVAPVTFLKWGTYDVTARVIGYCDTVTSTLRIRVKKNPQVVLKETASCPVSLVLADASSYSWWNNTPSVLWTIRRADGADQAGDYVVAGAGLTELYPRVEFKRPGKYRVKATLKSAGCPTNNPAADPSHEVEYWIYDPAVYGDVALKAPVPKDPLTADVCENEMVDFENTMTDEAGSLSWAWEVTGGATKGWQFEENGAVIPVEEGRVKKSPSIRFLKYGEYRVKVTTRSLCNPPKMKEFKVIVRGIPEIVLQPRMEKMCADKALRLEGVYLEYVDKKNSELSYEWTVMADRVVTPPVFDATAEFPVFDFNKENARYTITLTAYSKCAVGGVQTFHSEVDVISIYQKAIFETDSIGCTDFELALENASVGDSLGYSWDVRPENASGGGWAYTQGDGHAEKPHLKISEAGFYNISLAVNNICGTDVYEKRVRAYSVPDVKIADIADVCEPLEFIGKERIIVDDHNDPVKNVKWTITPRPGSLSEEYAYVNGTSTASVYPDILFKACDYEVKVEYSNRCAEPGRATFSVRVDKFVPIETLEDKAVCSQSGQFELQALPAGGTWTLKDVTKPGADKILTRTPDGKDWFNPAFDPYFDGDVELVYSKANFTCMARDTMKVHVWPLPRVDAGVDLGMCVNDPPFLLENGTPKNGYWTREDGSILGGDYYTVVGSGDFKLKYYFTDGNGCVNVDSTLMTVHPLPNTKFEVKALNCIRTEVEIKPEQLDGNRFLWDYGDGVPKEISKGDTVHVYGDIGFHKVSNVTTSQYGCVKRSDTVEIEIVNVPPPAFFKVDTLKGCARFGVEPGNELAVFKVRPSVDAATYADRHNYLSFKWNYGDGTESDVLEPVSPKYYPSGSWDTTYLVRFTVSNMCGVEEHEEVVTVLSAPKVKFALKHEWECTPVVLELQNTTTGNNVVFDWTFENRRTGEVVERTAVRNPVHEFTTDSSSTTYYITLKASNACDDDVHIDSLVVKPRTISAHFTPSKREVCVGEEICFRNNSTDTLSAIENIYWNFGDGGRDTLWNPCHVYGAAQSYPVSLLIDNGCGFHSVTDTIMVRPLPRLELAGEDHLCETDTFTFVVRSDQELKRVTWDFGDGLTSDRDSVWHVYEGYGKFAVTVTGVSAQIAGCVAKELKEVEVYNKPIVTITPSDTAHCSPFLYQPETTGEGLFLWDFGDGSKLASTNEHEYVNATDTVQKFQVKVYVETDKGCKSEYDRGVTVYYLPKAVVGKEVTKGKPEKVVFQNLSERATDAFWELPLKGAVHSLEEQTEEFHVNGLYKTGLIVSSIHGCQDTAEVEHLVRMKGLYFPNTFIPGSTNGRVNRFNGIAIGLKEYWLEIYDFYGNKIWETRALESGAPSEGWDGRNSQGELLPQGSYVWRVRAIFVNDEVWTGKNNDSEVRETVQGTVLLLRE